jgi:hypothetical protein
MKKLNEISTGKNSLTRLVNKEDVKESYRKVGFSESLRGYSIIDSVSNEMSEFIRNEFKTIAQK